MQNRNNTFDEIAGLLVVYMVIYHVMQHAGMQNSKGMAILSYLNFFMPWFFYKGGMFFMAQDTAVVIKKSGRRLICPYVVWSIVGMLVFLYIACYVEHAFTLWGYLKMNLYLILTEGSLPGNLPLWFLVALFVARIVFNECHKNAIHPIWPTALGITVSVLLHFTGLQLPYYVNYISSGIFFFGVGIMLRDKTENKQLQLLCIVVYVLLSVVSKPIVDIRTNVLSEGYYLLWPIWSVAGIVTINTVFLSLQRFANIGISLLRLAGKHSMYIYVIHWPILLVIFRVLL